MRFLREIDALARRIDDANGRMGWQIGLHALLHGRLATRYRAGTLKDLLDSCTQDPRLRAVLAGQNGDYGLPPSRARARRCTPAGHPLPSPARPTTRTAAAR